MAAKDKIVSLKKLSEIVSRERKKGITIAFTNGCFDILHLGHVTYLEKAKKGDRLLIVGLNSDASVRRLKGPQRPVNPQKARAYVLASLESVDYVTIFTDDTPYSCIKALAPDVLIKGADWKGKEVVGADIVKARGGRVEFIHYVNNYSTTRLIGAIS